MLKMFLGTKKVSEFKQKITIMIKKDYKNKKESLNMIWKEIEQKIKLDRENHVNEISKEVNQSESDMEMFKTEKKLLHTPIYQLLKDWWKSYIISSQNNIKTEQVINKNWLIML